MARKMDLSSTYMVLNILRGVKNEMDRKNITFEQLLEHYEEAVRLLEEQSEEN